MSPEAAEMRAPEPEGAAWDAPVEEATLVFVDLEMTGLDVVVDRVVQLCLERVAAGRLEDRLVSYVRAVPRDPAAARVHGIDARVLAAAPPFESLAPRVERLLDGAVVVAHAAAHDVAFLRAELARAGRSWHPAHALDTLRLAQLAFPEGRHGLVELARRIGIEHSEPHRADHDVRALRALFAHLVAVLKPPSLRALWRMQDRRRRVRPEVLALAERACSLDLPVRVRYRPATKGIEEFGFCVRAVRADLDPPRVLGYLQRSRGRRELRADRIVTLELAGS